MGTTAQKLEYLNTTKTKIKESINLTNANITNEPFRQYAVILKNRLPEIVGDPSIIWNNYEHVTGSGTSFSINAYNSIFNYSILGDTSQNGTPTPNAPIPVNVVSGDNSIVVCGKNLIPFSNQDFTLKNIHYFIQNGSLYFNGTSTGETSSVDTTFKNNLSFTLPSGTYTISHKTGVMACYLYKYDDNTSILTLGTDTTSRTFTLDEETKLYIGFYVYQKTFTNINAEIMIEKSSTATTYEPYKSQSYNVNLGSLELCKIGGYQDYIYKDNGSWYLHKEIGKVVLDGSESSWIENITTKGLFQVTLTNVLNNLNTINALSNLLKGDTGINVANQIYSESINNTISTFSSNRLFFRINDYKENLAGLKTYLASNNLIAYYVLATPTNTEITDSHLLLQLDNLKLVNGLNNIITVGSDLNPFIDIEAIKYLD